MVAFVLVSAAVGFLNTLNNIAALTLFRGADFLAVFDKPQRDALGMLFHPSAQPGKLHRTRSSGVCGSFPLGCSSFAPAFCRAFIGVWLMINCFGWVALSLTALFFPAYYEAAFKMVATGLVWRIGDHALAADQGRKGANSSRCASAGGDLTLSLVRPMKLKRILKWIAATILLALVLSIFAGSSPTGCPLTIAIARPLWSIR